MSKSVSIATLMTREEFLACYGYQFVAMVLPAYGADGMSDSEREETFDSVGSGVRWAIRDLSARGARFAGLHIDARGEIRPNSLEPLTPQNKLLLWQFEKGSQLSPVVAIRETLRFLKKEGVNVDRGPLYEVLHQAVQDSDAAVSYIQEDPEVYLAMQLYIDEVYGKAGFVRKDKVLDEGELN